MPMPRARASRASPRPISRARSGFQVDANEIPHGIKGTPSCSARPAAHRPSESTEYPIAGSQPYGNHRPAPDTSGSLLSSVIFETSDSARSTGLGRKPEPRPSASPPEASKTVSFSWIYLPFVNFTPPSQQASFADPPGSLPCNSSQYRGCFSAERALYQKAG